jgi:hypothetical protein
MIVTRYHVGIALEISVIPAFFLAGALWGEVGHVVVFVVAAIVLASIRCPSCGKPIFKRGNSWGPWPARTCSCLYPLDGAPDGRLGPQ